MVHLYSSSQPNNVDSMLGPDHNCSGVGPVGNLRDRTRRGAGTRYGLRPRLYDFEEVKKETTGRKICRCSRTGCYHWAASHSINCSSSHPSTLYVQVSSHFASPLGGILILGY